MVTLLEEEHVDVVAGICGEEELRWWCEYCKKTKLTILEDVGVEREILHLESEYCKKTKLTWMTQ
jgi:hypothetical protein